MFTVNNTDEVERILELNEHAMSDNPVIACSARIAKDLFPITEIVFNREFERDPDAAIQGYSNFVQGIVINSVIGPNYCGHSECAEKMLKMIKELFVSHFDNTLKELPAILNQITKD